MTHRLKFAGRVFSLACMFAFGSCRPLTHPEVAVRVLALEGDATATVAGKTTVLTRSGPVFPGAVVLCAKIGRLDLMLLPGILVELAGGSEIEITQLRLARDGNESMRPMTARSARIRLRRGTLIASVGEAQTDPRLVVDFPGGTLFAGPSRTFQLGVTSDPTQVMSVRGQIAVQPAGAPQILRVPAGYFATFPNTKPIPRPVALASGKMQAELHQTLEIEKQLLRLSREHEVDFKPW